MSNTHRGQWRGRGRGSGRGWQQSAGSRESTFGQRASQPAPAEDETPKGALIDTITPTPTGADSSESMPTISDCDYIASYNWMNKKQATIFVPGAPPAWSPPAGSIPPKLQQDQGNYFRDPNAARWPRYPTEVAVHTLYHRNAAFNPHGVDIVGCGNTLGNLLRFAGSKPQPFHINAQLIGSTLFLVRQQKSPTELIKDVCGYGHTFPEAYTTWDAEVRGSTSHQRLISYTFDGLRVLVRSESDGYLKSKLGGSSNGDPRPSHTNHGLEPGLASLVSSTISVAVSSEAPLPSSKLEIQPTRCSIPQAAIFDLKTRSAKTKYDMEDIYPRLWLNQTPNFIIAYHKFGQFHDIEVKDVQAGVSTWEHNNAEMLQRFSLTLKALIECVKSVDGKKVEVWWRGTGPLEVRRMGDANWNALPRDLMARWANVGLEDGSDDDDEDEDQEEGDDDYLNF